MKKSLHVMGDPKLDRLFTKAYYATLKEVERKERRQEIKDRREAFYALFEQDLQQRDLSPEERKIFTKAFKDYVEHAEERRVARKKIWGKGVLLGLGALLALAALIFVLYMGVKRPFVPLAKIEGDLQYYIEKVEGGYGAYSKRFYSTLSRYERRLGEVRSDLYEERMYRQLDRHFQELLPRLRRGEVIYFDDAKEWAGYFQEAEERRARKEQAKNAMLEGVGGRVEGTVESVLEGAKGIIDRTLDIIEQKKEE